MDCLRHPFRHSDHEELIRDIDTVEKAQSELLRAAGSLDLKKVQAILTAFDDIDINQNGGVHHLTALHICALKKDGQQGCQLLLEHGASLDVLDNKSRTPLHCAARQGRASNCAMLLSKGADPNALDRRKLSCLMDASRNGHVDCVRLLLKAGASCTAQSAPYKWTALHYAACNGWIDVLKELLQTESSFEFVNHLTTDSYTALHIAARNGHVDVITHLLDIGADPEIDPGSGTAFHLASSEGRLAAVERLIGLIPISQPCKHAPNLTACQLALIGGHKLVVERLLQLGAEWQEIEAVLLNGQDCSAVFTHIYDSSVIDKAVVCDTLVKLAKLLLIDERFEETVPALLSVAADEIKEDLLELLNSHEVTRGSCVLLGSVADEEMMSEFVSRNGDDIRRLLDEHPHWIIEVFAFMLEWEVFRPIVIGTATSLPFDTKVKWLRDRLVLDDDMIGGDTMLVHRDDLFRDSCGALLSMDTDELRRVTVSFAGEAGVGIGVRREWLSLLAREFFNPDNALFTPSDDNAFQPNPQSSVNPDHLSYFAFCGRVVGMAIAQGDPIDVHFTRSFYRQILGIQPQKSDVESLDAQFRKSIAYVLEKDVDFLDLTFCVDVDWFGYPKRIDLIRNGSEVSVTNENKDQYVDLLVQQRVVEAVREQIDAFKQGLFLLIPPGLLSIFDEYELEILIAGQAEIDITDWRDNTYYVNGYTAESQVIQSFWRVVENLSPQEMSHLLQFTTGSCRVPPGGFSALIGPSGATPFTIARIEVATLPHASTCFNMLKLSDGYSNDDELEEAIKCAIQHHVGFGEP